MAALALVLLAVPLGPSRATAAAPTELFFSEYVEGSSNNKALEIYNGTGAAVDLGTGGYSIQMFFNGSSSAGLTIPLSGTVASGDVFVVTNASANATIKAVADQVTTSTSWFNGDDAVVLRKGATIIDAIGQIGSDPGSEWGSGLTSTQDNTLRRKAAVIGGDTNASDPFDPSIEWDGYPLDTFDGLGQHLFDAAPAVTDTVPSAGATGVGPEASVTVTFSEAVTTSADWAAIVCATSGPHSWTATGGPATFTLDPATNFAPGETCQVTVSAAAVHDNDTTDPPDQMAADHTFTFTVTTDVCGGPATYIHDVQGSGSATPMSGSSVTVEGIVVGDYQQAGGFSGFYVQEEDADVDADPATSEGLFIFSTTAVSAGDLVRVSGRATEFANLTELASVVRVSLCATGASVTPTEVTLPVADLADFERYEGMLVHFTQTLTATETFGLGRFGEVRLAADGRLYTPTAITTPGAAAIAQEDLNRRRSFILDDGSNVQNADPTLYPAGGLSASNTLRSGYTVSGISGVFDQRFGSYRMQPVGPVSFTAANARTAAPAAVGGGLRVASFNVLNFFNGDGLGGGFPTARGASTPFELARQKAKEISALRALNGDIVGLMELENDAPPNSAIEDLVAGLNAAMGAGTYAFIDTGVIGTDAIKVALIYKPAAVMPVGAYRIIDSSVDPRFVDTKNRPSLAQTFQSKANGAKLTVVVNHLKSKGSACDDLLDPDTGDGQGNCNRTRTNAAAALVDWLATDPTGSGDPDVLLIGDMNSYTFEDPISTLTGGGYTNLVRRSGGLGAYSFVFNGEAGYLDHALATSTLASQVTGTTDWHINADEPVVLDYNTEFKTANQVTTFYDAGPYRSSDHDPVVVGIDLATTYVSVCDLTRSLVANRGIANSLCQKLGAADAAAARGQIETAHNVRDAYVNEVNAQRGKQIADADAAVLVAAAGAL